MCHQGSRADLSQSAVGRLGRVPAVLRSVVIRALADTPLRLYGEALAQHSRRAPGASLARRRRVARSSRR